MNPVNTNVSGEGEALELRSTSAQALQVLLDVSELVKARLSSLVLVTVAVGFQLGSVVVFDESVFWATLLGALLGAFGANALNQWWELRWDRQMARTRERPLPSGRMRPELALGLGLALLLGGTALLWALHPIAALVNMLIGIGYLLVYTPLKRRTAWSLLPGAIVGAAPPLIGWVAAHGALTAGAWSLFGIVFAWQLPHFLAIDWLHRNDYGRAGYRMVSRLDPSGRLTGGLAVATALLLLVVSLSPAWAGLGGPVYVAVAIALGLGFLALTVRFLLRPATRAARAVFLGSLLYLPLLLGTLVLSS